MPIVRVELSPGRTRQQKDTYVKRVTKLTAEVLKVPAEMVDVVFVEIDGANWARGGKYFSNPTPSDTKTRSKNRRK